MHLLVYKSAKNNLMNGELKGSLYVPFKGASKIPFREHLKLHKNVKKKIYLAL